MRLPQARFPRQAPDVSADLAVAARWRSAVKSSDSRVLKTTVAAVFGLSAVILLVVAVWSAAWAVQSAQPLGGGLALIVLGLSIAMGYEAWAVRPSSGLETISEIANAAFMAHRVTWVGVYLVIVLTVGLLTMHFTRLVQPDWAFLGATVLVFVNGALIAYWFEWLP
jgi:hypothetical protein